MGDAEADCFFCFFADGVVMVSKALSLSGVAVLLAAAFLLLVPAFFVFFVEPDVTWEGRV